MVELKSSKIVFVIIQFFEATTPYSIFAPRKLRKNNRLLIDWTLKTQVQTMLVVTRTHGNIQYKANETKHTIFFVCTTTLVCI